MHRRFDAWRQDACSAVRHEVAEMCSFMLWHCIAAGLGVGHGVEASLLEMLQCFERTPDDVQTFVSTSLYFTRCSCSDTVFVAAASF